MTDRPPRIRRYTLRERIGSGGGGEVWSGLMQGPAGFRKQVAVKLVQAGSDDEALLRREARMGALLRHPNIVDVYELGRAADGRWFLAMELVPGPTLQTLLHTMGALPGTALREIAVQVCRGLGHAHRLAHEDQVGLVHRDVKPSNVLLDPSGMVKVSDLGIARLAGDRIDGIEGTPGYLAPEQLKGVEPRPTADVFSMGVLLWAMAIGQTPIRPRKGVQHALRAAVQAQDQVKTVGATLEEALPGLHAVVVRCLDPNPEARFPDARELRRAIQKLPEPPGQGLHELMASFEAVKRGPAPTDDRVTEKSSVRSTSSLRTEDRELIGRQRERTKLEEVLVGEAALVTLKGIGGVGKTHLAVSVANRWRASTRAVRWVELAAVRDRAGVLSALAAVCRLAVDDDATAVVGRALQALGDDALLVLDGPDEVTDEVRDLVVRWRALAPTLRVLVTARHALRIDDETVVELGPLSLDDSVALFLARRQQEPTPVEVLREQLRPLGGLPLAIELAARGEEAGVHAGSLADTLAWSFEKLAPWSRNALGQLSAFRGTFTVEAAESVVDVSPWAEAPWPLEVVDDLWQRSLLYVRPTRSGPRLGVYPAVRAYVGERLERAEGLDEAMKRHGDWYARFGDPAWLEGLEGREGEARIRALARDLDDIVAACDRALTRGDVAVAVSTALVASEVLQRRGPRQRAARLLVRVLALPDAPRRDELLEALAEFEESVERFDEALAAAPTDRRRARVMAAKARLLHQIPDLDACIRCAQEALSLGEAVHDTVVQGRALVSLGVAKRQLGAPQEAMAHLVDGGERLERVGCTVDRSYAWLSLGNLYNLLNRVDDAEDAYQRAEKGFRRAGMRGARATAIANLTLIDRARGDYRAAEKRAHRALELHRAVGDRLSELSDQSQLASSLAGQGRVEEALAVFAEIVGPALEARRFNSACLAMINMAHWLVVTGQAARARSQFRQALALATEHDITWMQALALGNLGILTSELDHDSVTATQQLDEAIELARQCGSVRMEGGLLAERVRARIDDDDDHHEALSRAEALLNEAGDREELGKLYATRARLLARAGDRAAAEAILVQIEGGPGEELAARIAEVRAELDAT